MYSNLDKYFKNPAEGSIFRERGQSNIFESLAKTQESTINIFWLWYSILFILIYYVIVT